MRRSPTRSAVCAVLIVTTVGMSCRVPPADRSAAPPALTASSPFMGAQRPQVAFTADAGRSAMEMKVASTLSTASAAKPTVLPEPLTAALLARLAPLPDLTNINVAAPVMRAPTPPARTTAVRPIAFPVTTGSPVPDRPSARPAGSVKPLAPPEITPRDTEIVASEIVIRFGEPMIPVSAVGGAATPPVSVSPPVTGTWRWVDTRVVKLTAAPRLAMATSYTITVPAGTKSLAGSPLATDVRATFTTPPLMIESLHPSEPRFDSPVVVKLNQAIERDRVSPFVRVRTRDGRAIPVRAMSLPDAQKLWANNPMVAHDKDLKALDPRSLIIAPTTAWPLGGELMVELAAGAPALEGPLRSRKQARVRVDIAPAFSITGIRCFRDERPRRSPRCPAGWELYAAFTNAIADRFRATGTITVDGNPIDEVAGYGEELAVFAPNEVGRTHTLEISDALVDVFGQRLTGSRRAMFSTRAVPASPSLRAESGMVILDPRFEIPQWVIGADEVMSLRVQLYRVTPQDYFAFDQYQSGSRKAPPGHLVSDTEHRVGVDYGVDARIDLRPALTNGTGHVVAIATAEPPPGRTIPAGDLKAVTWLQVTRLGISARLDGDQLSGWVVDVRPNNFLKPVAGVETSLVTRQRRSAPTATTDAAGHVRYDALPTRSDGLALLLARAGSDSTFDVLDAGYEKAVRQQRARWYVTDDRFTYKPGETVHIKGWVRRTHDGVNPDLSLLPANQSITYVLVDSRGTKLSSGSMALTRQGGFDTKVALPPTANLGTAWFTFSTSQSWATRHPIAIREFRTPAFGVTLSDDVQYAGARPVVLGETIEMAAEAAYYAGGGLAGAGVEWHAKLTPASYRPPGWDRFWFAPPYPRERDGTAITRSSTLSSASRSTISVDITALRGSAPHLLEVSAAVTDVDRIAIRDQSRPIVVHPSALYVGLRELSGPGGVLEAIVTDIDGAPVAGVDIAIDVEGVRTSSSSPDHGEVVDTQHCALKSSTAPVTCAWKRGEWSIRYAATARIADTRGRINVAHYPIPWFSKDSAADLSIVPDRKTYRAGDVAKLEIRSKIFPATAIVSIARQGIISQRRLELASAVTAFELPIEPSFITNVHVLVDRWGDRSDKNPGSTLSLPDHTHAELDVPVDVDSARLEMIAKARAPIVQPGGSATFDVEVRHDGKPVAGAEVALLAIDEGVLALSDKHHGDPLAPFYEPVEEGTRSVSTLSAIEDDGAHLAGPPGVKRYRLEGQPGWGVLGRGGYGTGGGGYGLGGGSSGSAGAIAARNDFRPTAVFSPTLITDAAGRATVTVTMPESLTRFRVVALATSNMRYFGKAEGTIVTQRAINARITAPRFVTQGDAFSLPVVVQNLSPQPRTIDVAVRTANLDARGPRGQRVVVAAGQRAELRFELATARRGKAAIQTIVRSDDFSDASMVTLPVYEPATTEAFATYGVVDDKPQFEQLQVPKDVFREVGGVEVQLASTQLQGLTDAFWYLQAYPYECAEQRSARMLATAAMFDIVDAFAAPGTPSKAEVEATRRNDLRLLAKDQLPDGGWGYFEGMSSDPYVSIQVLSAVAASGGEHAIKAKAISYVTKLADKKLALLEAASSRLPTTNYEVALVAAALGALARAGVDVRPRAVRLHDAASALASYPMDAKARLLAIVAGAPSAKAMRAGLLAAVVSAASETASSATIAASYTEAERLLLVSNSKTNALALEALIREAPDHPLVLKLARGVLDARKRGRWMSTQENLAALTALRRYFDTYEKVTPRYTGRLWIGAAGYAQQSFAGRSSASASAFLDWTALAPGSTHDVALRKDGDGRMYYRIGITYAPRQASLGALDAGFVVRRTYTAVDDPGDVTRGADGRWHIKLGARVRVELEAVNTTTRYGVALVDPIPAGLESVDSSLRTSVRTAATASDERWDHRNLRDNRSEAFAMTLREGAHRFSYTARAITPGTFTAAPAKAEEMYSPETFGRSASEVVVVQ
ncbi:MAG: alpha-2-macroglobulin family protein [Kofleriaceae bacterium]